MLVAAVVLLASMVFIFGVLYEYFTGIQKKQLDDELQLAAHAVEMDGKNYLSSLSADRYRLTWIDSSGSVIFDTVTDENTMENHADRTEVMLALENGYGSDSRYSSTLLEKTIYSARRLDDGTVLRISVSSTTIGMLAFGMLQPIFIVLVIALILSAVLAKQISKNIVKPLCSLDLENPLENDTYEELSPLLNRLNQQRRQIDLQIRELQQKKDEFAQITGSMKEGLVLINEKGTVISINQAAIDIFGADKSCVGKDFLIIEHSHDMNNAVKHAFESGHSIYRTERCGREYQFDISRIESDNKVVGAVVLAFDITEQAFAEQNRREFTANVSHELKTPLQSIMGSAELIENGLVKPEDMPRFVGHIRKESARLVALIEDIIRLSQLDEGSEFPLEPIDLLNLSNDAADSLKSAADANNVTVTVSGDHAVLTGVRRLLTETIYNLCDNAIKYNKPGGYVNVEVSDLGSKVSVKVSDSGIGIPPEHQSRVFERFYRVDKSHSRESGGTGLGLSIVKHAVQYMNGTIDLHSSVGSGTEITLTFPKNR